MKNNFNYWSQVLTKLKKKVGTADFQAWFSKLEFVDVANEGRKAVLKTQSSFSKKYIERKFSKQLREAINEYYPNVIHLEIKVSEAVQTAGEPIQDTLNLTPQTSNERAGSSDDSETKVSSYLPRKSLNNLNPKYRFDNYVVAGYNEFVTNIANGVTKELGTLYNPLFIHSPVGLGKTHLLQAIGHKVLEDNPNLNIKYVPSETFFNQFYLSLKKGKANEFREYYHSVDVLLIDDIQFVGGKEAFQEVFFHIFNILHQDNKQIIITSDKNPKELIGVEERLMSRFEWGMVVDIPTPDLEDRKSIFRDKMDNAAIALSDEHVDLICNNVTTNIRELEGVLNKIRATLNLSLDKELADSDLTRILQPYIKTQVQLNDVVMMTPESINQAVCRLFAIQSDELKGSSRKQNIALARQLSFWLYKNELKLSYPHIGKLFGGRDHTTIMHGCRKIEKLRTAKDNQIENKLSLVKEMLAA